MSDSENDLLPGNVFTYQNENTIISAKGPGINSTNMTNFSFRNNVMTSTMHMPRNFEAQRFREPSFDQRSMYYRRETSPMSMYSGSDMRQRNYPQSCYGGMGSQRSMYYGRSGSPMSMRSMDSNATVSAADIALAFKNVNFNKHDFRIIQEAYNKFMKRKIRKKIEKRRNMRLFLKGYRRRSGYDSGELGSDSSLSSDDCKSTGSALLRDNMSCRSVRTDISDFRRRIRESDMYKDCTDSFKHNAFKNMHSISSANDRGRFNMNSVGNMSQMPQREFAVPNPVNKSMITQKERFTTGYLLPSQRFNKSVASLPILERDPRLQARQNRNNSNKQINKEIPVANGHLRHETDSDQEEIFADVTVREKSTQNVTEHGKRGLEIEDDNNCSARKRAKLSSPAKQLKKVNGVVKQKSTNSGKNKNNKDDDRKDISNDEDSECAQSKQTNEFEFIKPQFPVRKSGPNKPKEKLISKSATQLAENIIPLSKSQPVLEETSKETAPVMETATEEQPDASLHSNSDQSMRPSFIKRKLFTQKMDVAEKKNLSSGALNVNSPQTNVYSAIQKEKHKARKLVTNQSCLSRDVAQEGNNLLDLIHKIVPPDRMNITNVTNKTSISTSVSSKNPVNDDDKWDVTSVISTCNNDDVSDTFTDEDIFAADNTNKNGDINVQSKDNGSSKDKVKENKKNDSIQKQTKTKKAIVNTKKTNLNKTTTSNEKRILAEKLPQNNISTKPTVEVKEKTRKPSDSKKISVNTTVPASECRIVVEKLPPNKSTFKPPTEVCKPTNSIPENDINKKSVYNCVSSFWDCESDIESPAPKRPALRSEAVKENLYKSIVVEEKIPKPKNTINVSLASVSSSIQSRAMPTNSLATLRKFNISRTLSIKSFLTPKQMKCNSVKPTKDIKDNKDKEIPKNVDTPKIAPTIEPVKKTSKQNTQPTKTVESSNKKPEPKKTNRKNISDLLNASVITPLPKARAGKRKNAEPNDSSIAEISLTRSRSVRTPKRKACCNESSDHNMTTRSTKTSKQKEPVKKISKQNTNPELKKKTEAKKTNRKNNKTLLDTSEKGQTAPKSKAKPTKANLKLNITANSSISGPRRTPKRKCCNKSDNEHNMSTRSSAKKNTAPKEKISRSKVNKK